MLQPTASLRLAAAALAALAVASPARAETPSAPPAASSADAVPRAVPVDAELVQPWLNGHFTGWDKDGVLHHRLARALGHDVVLDLRSDAFPGRTEASAPHSAGLGFFVSDPHKVVQTAMGGDLTDAEVADAVKKYPYSFAWYPELPRAIDTRELDRMRGGDPKLFEVFKAGFERTKAWANTDKPFPENLAVLQVWGGGYRWEPISDFQQQAVIDEHVAAIVDYLRRTEAGNDFGYHFAGILMDVVEQWDGFNWNTNRPLPGPSSTERYAVPHDGITHEYATFREGWYHFLGALRDGLDAAFPDRQSRFVWEPTPIYETWVKPLYDGAYASVTPDLIEKIKGDALLDEKPGMQYLVDPRLQEHGWPLHRLGTSSSDLFAKNPNYPTQLVYLGEISSRGGYLLSYGSFDRSRRTFDQFGGQFTLIRALSAWQNQHGTPVDRRTWDAAQDIYASPTAYADAHGLAGLHPDGRRVFGVLLDADARLPLAAGVTLSNPTGANSFWEPDGAAAVEFDGASVRPAAGATFPVSFIADAALQVDGQAVFAPPPGVTLAQDRSAVEIPNTKLLNGDFADGLEGWSATGDATLRKVDGGALVTRRSKPWHALRQDVQGVLMFTRQGGYRLTARVKPVGTGGTIRGMVSVFENNVRTDHATDPIPASAVGPDGWITIDQTLPLDWEDWIERAELMVERSGDTGDYTVGAVTFEHVK